MPVVYRRDVAARLFGIVDLGDSYRRYRHAPVGEDARFRLADRREKQSASER